MKKSDVQKDIDRLLCAEVFGPHREPNGTWDTYTLAGLILDVVENAGMLPPEYNQNQNASKGIPSYMVSEWEPEDES